MIHQPLLPDGVHPRISSSLRLLVLCLVRPDLFVIYYRLSIFFKGLISFIGSFVVLDIMRVFDLHDIEKEGSVQSGEVINAVKLLFKDIDDLPPQVELDIQQNINGTGKNHCLGYVILV